MHLLGSFISLSHWNVLQLNMTSKTRRRTDKRRQRLKKSDGTVQKAISGTIKNNGVSERSIMNRNVIPALWGKTKCVSKNLTRNSCVVTLSVD